jgi:hypothetical protein
MSYFLVGIRGDPARAAGLLARAGIQNLVADEGVTARLVAEMARQPCSGFVRPWKASSSRSRMVPGQSQNHRAPDSGNVGP